MKDVSHSKCIPTDIVLFSKNLVIDFKDSNEFCTLCFNNLLVRDVIGIAESILAKFRFYLELLSEEQLPKQD